LLPVKHVSKSQVYDRLFIYVLKVFTTLLIFCLQIGHNAEFLCFVNTVAQSLQTHKWPLFIISHILVLIHYQGINTVLMSASIQTLHSFSISSPLSSVFNFLVDGSTLSSSELLLFTLVAVVVVVVVVVVVGTTTVEGSSTFPNDSQVADALQIYKMISRFESLIIYFCV
jgi:vacuolar-type H+-ATPase subunit I/STV1